MTNGLDFFLVKAEQADDEILKQENPDINLLVLPTSYKILEESLKRKTRGTVTNKSIENEETEGLLKKNPTDRESLSYRELIEVIVDIPWEAMLRVSPNQSTLKTFIKLPMVLNLLSASFISSLATVVIKVLMEVLVYD